MRCYFYQRLVLLVIIATLCAACTSTRKPSAVPPTTTQTLLSTATQAGTPTALPVFANAGNYGPQEIRYAYQIDPLLQQG
jgi:hypothetical protein